MGVRMGRSTILRYVNSAVGDKAELLRVQGLNVMSTAEYQMATQMGSSHLYNTIDLLLMYDYCHGIVSTINTITMVLYERLLL
jgi:hypothetical protein